MFKQKFVSLMIAAVLLSPVMLAPLSAQAQSSTPGKPGGGLTTRPPVTRDCTYAGQSYSEGSVIYVGTQQYRCSASSWVKTG